MPETPDRPEGTVEEDASAEDLLALLAPGAPSADASRDSTTDAGYGALPDSAANYEPQARPQRGTVGHASDRGPGALNLLASIDADAFGSPAAHAMDPPATDLVAPDAPVAPGLTGFAVRRASVPGSGGAAPVRIGRRFQPLPGTLPAATGAPGSPAAGLTLVAAAGTPVHAVESGTVTLGAHQGDPLRLVGEGGHTIHYGGLAAGSVAVSDGARVAAGTILGTVAAPRLSTTGSAAQPHLHLRIVDGTGADVDVAGFLIGLPDPNELGHAAVGAGVDVDPDALDQEIVRGWAS